MKMKTSLYLDTSVPSAFFDTSKPIRQIITQKWFENDVSDFHIVTSVVTIDEINGFQNETKKLNILELIAKFNVEILDVNDNIRNLANLYIKKGAIPKYELEDALHIAVASYNKIENLVSWNFKHIVSVNPIRKIHEINKTIGYQEILIGSPELFGGYKYGNI